MDSKIVNNHKKKNPNVKSTETVKKKPRKRIIRATWFEKDEFEKLLKLFQKHYPKEFPKKETTDSIPKLSILKLIKKEKKINITDLMLSRFLHQYIRKQEHKSLLRKNYESLLKFIQEAYPKEFSLDHSISPTPSVLNTIKKENKIKIPHLILYRFFNQYLKNQSIFLRKKEKQNKAILIALQSTYPDAFPKDSPKLLKLGIFEDIQKDGKIHITDEDLKSFLEYYTKTEDYLNCYFTNPVRYDLEGNIVAPTTKQERFFAKKTLGKRHKK